MEWAASRSSSQRGAGPRIWDVDGNEYIDYVLSWGALALGHAPQSRARRARRDDAQRHELRHSDGARGAARRVDRRAHAAPRDDAVRLERHGSDDERGARRARRHRARRHPQVRRLLPRPRRLLSRPRRLGRRDARPTEFAGRAGRACRAHRRRAVQRSRRRRVAARRASCRGDHRRADRRQWWVHRARSGVSPRPQGARRPVRRAADLRRGNDRVSHRLWRRARAFRRHGRSDHARER